MIFIYLILDILLSAEKNKITKNMNTFPYGDLYGQI